MGTGNGEWGMGNGEQGTWNLENGESFKAGVHKTGNV